MKNPEKQFLKASKIMRENSYRTLDGRHGSNILYYQAQKMSLEAQEEMGRQNKTKLLKEIKRQKPTNQANKPINDAQNGLVRGLEG